MPACVWIVCSSGWGTPNWIDLALRQADGQTREEEYFRALARIEGEESMAII